MAGTKNTIEHDKRAMGFDPDFEKAPSEPILDGDITDPDVAFSVDISIDDADLFTELLGGVDVREVTSDQLLENLFLAGPDMPARGLCDLQCVEISADSKSLSVKVIANLNDRDALIVEAKERYEACWGDSEWEPKSASEAMYEVLLASNDNPSPSDVGFTIEEMAFKTDPEEDIPTP